MAFLSVAKLLRLLPFIWYSAFSTKHHEALYYEKLIKQEMDRAFKHPLPQDSSAFIPKSTELKGYGTFDYIVVGAGSAGAVVASRLSEIPSNRVLLLEAGGNETDFSDIPRLNVFLQGLEFNWNYNTTPQAAACLGMLNNQCGYPRGRGLGGSSIINACMYVRGNKLDYDSWREQGNPGWGYDEILPYFLKSENCATPGDPGYHGFNGPMNVERHKPNSVELRAFLKANVELGRKLVDYNGADQLGVSQLQYNTINGRRLSAAKAFLTPVLFRSNLVVRTNSLVTRILIHPVTKSAYGVLFSSEGQLFVATVREEVILSGGSINTPQLLMLSGIGNYRHLHELSIPLVQNLAVGKNLQEHPTYFALHFVTNYTEPVKSLPELVREYLRGYGTYTLPAAAEGLGFYQTHLEKTPGYPDIELIIVTSNNTDGVLQKAYHYSESAFSTVWETLNPAHSFTIIVILLHPKSHGTVRLKSSNPYDYPLIDTRYFSDPEGDDLERMYLGIQLAIEITETKAFKRLNTTLHHAPLPVCQHHAYLSRDYWKCQLQQLALQIFHPVGTCKMGPDPRDGAVVDSKLRVYGVGGLRIADASIAPTMISGHTHAMAVMIGEKVADMIKYGNYI